MLKIKATLPVLIYPVFDFKENAGSTCFNFNHTSLCHNTLTHESIFQLKPDIDALFLFSLTFFLYISIQVTRGAWSVEISLVAEVTGNLIMLSSCRRK